LNILHLLMTLSSSLKKNFQNNNRPRPPMSIKHLRKSLPILQTLRKQKKRQHFLAHFRGQHYFATKNEEKGIT
jgi:hypothetical protein